MAKQLVEEAEKKADVPAETYLSDSWYCAKELIETIEYYGKDWITALKSDRLVEYAGDEHLIDELHEQVELVDREIDGETYRIWTKKLPVSKLGEQKVIIAKKVTDKDEENPVRYLVTNKIDAKSADIIESYGFRWRIETFFEDTKQDLGFADCEVQLRPVPSDTGS